MKLDVVFQPSALAAVHNKENSIAIVIDVLRASATMCALLEAGCRELVLLSEPQEAIQMKHELYHDSADVILVGERQGIAPAGFDFGNSPCHIRVQNLKHKIALYTTSNGTRMLQLTSSCRAQLVGSFVNISAVMHKVQSLISNTGADTILLCCSGNDGAFSFEDSFFAGAFLSRYIANGYGHSLTDAAKAAIRIANSYMIDSRNIVKSARHARLLDEMGFAEDVHWCVQSDTVSCVPVCKDGRVTINF